MIERSDDALQHIAAELALGHRLDRVARKFRGEQGFELQFLNFSLKLLRALFGAPFQLFDLSLHRGDGLVFLHHFEFQFFFGFFLGFVAFAAEIGLDALGDGQIQFALGVVQLALLADQFRLRLLGLGELGIPLFQYFLKSTDFFGFLIEIIAESELSFLLLFGGDADALLLKFLGDLLVQGCFAFSMDWARSCSDCSRLAMSVSFCAKRCSNWRLRMRAAARREIPSV